MDMSAAALPRAWSGEMAWRRDPGAGRRARGVGSPEGQTRKERAMATMSKASSRTLDQPDVQLDEFDSAASRFGVS